MSDENRQFETPDAVMRRALRIARHGIGYVEPNPAVGAVITDDNLRFLAEGTHHQFGGPHAEVNAIHQTRVPLAGSTLFVTLEPCAHHGKTPPCTDTVIAAGIRRVFIATADPAPHTHGAGIERLKSAGIEVHVGLCESQAQRLIAPFRKLQCSGEPYVLAKWAMTIDGKIASKTGSSKWISSERSREVVHRLRGRVDGIITGIKTVLADDPLLTARPTGPRVATRIILDSYARTPLESQLMKTIDQAPVLIFVTDKAATGNVHLLRDRGAHVVVAEHDAVTGHLDLRAVLQHLGRKQMTNILLEAGPTVLGAFFDAGAIDEVHCFIAPKLIGGAAAPSPLAGLGRASMSDAMDLQFPRIEFFDGDIYFTGELNPTGGRAGQ